jgi:hypothetical protein
MPRGVDAMMKDINCPATPGSIFSACHGETSAETTAEQQRLADGLKHSPRERDSFTHPLGPLLRIKPSADSEIVIRAIKL